MSALAWSPRAACSPVFRALEALCISPDSPTPDFLKEHRIVVADDAGGGQHHARRAYIDAVKIPPQKEAIVRPPRDIGDWETSGNCSALGWAGRLADGAHCYLTCVPQHTVSMPAVDLQVPSREDEDEVALYCGIWETSKLWSCDWVFAVGDLDRFFGPPDLVGCILPIRPQPEPAASLYRGELCCALLLLHRQLKYDHPLASSVTIVATTESRVRIHEAYLDEVNTDVFDDSAPVIRIVKRVDRNIADLVGDEPAAHECWRDVMSYMCFTHQDRWAVGETVEARLDEYLYGDVEPDIPEAATTVFGKTADEPPPLRVDATRIPIVEIPVQPKVINTKSDAPSKSPGKTADAVPPIPRAQTPRTPLAEFTMHANAISGSSSKPIFKTSKPARSPNTHTSSREPPQ